MQDTTIRVSRSNRDEVKAIAAERGVTLDETLSLLLRRYRQHEIGSALADYEPDRTDVAVLDAGAATVAGG